MFKIIKIEHKTSQGELFLVSRAGASQIGLTATLLDDMATSKRKKNEEHGVRMPCESDEVISARPPFAREPIFHGAFAGARPPHDRAIVRAASAASKAADYLLALPS